MCRIPPTTDRCSILSSAAPNSSFPELGNIRPSKHSVVVLLPPPPHPLRVPLRGETLISIFAGVMCVSRLWHLVAEMEWEAMAAIFPDRQEAGLMVHCSQVPFNLAGRKITSSSLGSSSPDLMAL